MQTTFPLIISIILVQKEVKRKKSGGSCILNSDMITRVEINRKELQDASGTISQCCCFKR